MNDDIEGAVTRMNYGVEDNAPRGIWIGIVFSCLFWIVICAIVWMAIR